MKKPKWLMWLCDEWWAICRYFTYREVLRQDADWDWGYLARLMEFKLRLMARHFEQFGHHVGSEKDVRQMERVAAVLKRMHSDHYIMSDYHTDNWQGQWTGRRWGDWLMLNRDRFYIDRNTGCFKDGRKSHSDMLYRQDFEYLVKQLRHLRDWWD